MYNIIIGLAEYVQNFNQIYKTLAGTLTCACMFIFPSDSGLYKTQHMHTICWREGTKHLVRFPGQSHPV